MEEFPNKTFEEAETEWIRFRSEELLFMSEYGYDCENNLENKKVFYENFYKKYNWFYKFEMKGNK